MTTWTNVNKSVNGISEVDFLFSDGLDFLFSDGTDYVFVESVATIQWTDSTKSSTGWTNSTKNTTSWGSPAKA